jgi:3-oxoacyl-[acyl-carrier-protein] synthase-3
MFIQHVSTRLPEMSINLLEQSELFNLTSFKALIYRKFIGIELVPVAIPGEMEIMLEQTVAAAVPFDYRERIKLVVHAHTCPVVGNYGALSMQRVLRRQGLRKALFIGMCANRCASIFDAMQLIQLLLQQQPDALALLITGECAVTQELRLVENTALMGDAAGAMLFGSRGQGNELLACCSHTHGQYARGVWLEGTTRAQYETAYPAMMLQIIEHTLAQAGMTLDQVRWVIPHNVNRKSWIELARTIDLPLSRLMLENIPFTGHCFGSDMMLNLSHLTSTGALVKDDVYLMIAVGLGGSFGAALFRY